MKRGFAVALSTGPVIVGIGWLFHSYGAAFCAFWVGVVFGYWLRAERMRASSFSTSADQERRWMNELSQDEHRRWPN